MKMAGGQIPENIKNPDPEEYIPLLEETHCIKRWDAAPELPGAMQFGKYITSKGVLASVGHTQAEFEDILTAYEVGYTHATHFYNAMPGFHKRREYKYEGTVESIYLLDDMTVEVVADGIHVPPTILRLVYKIKGVERTCLITDALACAASDSQVAFDPRVIIEDGVCKLADRSALAGSVATMDVRWCKRPRFPWRMPCVWPRRLPPVSWAYPIAREPCSGAKTPISSCWTVT